MALTLSQVIRHFSDEATARAFLEAQRWTDGPECPRCQAKRISRFKDGKTIKCLGCKHQFTVTSGTAIHGSKLPISQWVIASYLMIARRKGVPSPELARILGVTQKTAWFMLQRIRQMMAAHAPDLLEGTVMTDETYVGGLQKNRHKNKKKKPGEETEGRMMWGKVPVMGALTTTGKVYSRPIANLTSASLHGFLVAKVTRGSHLVTDEFGSYRGIEAKGYTRTVVNHKAGQYVNDEGASTNALESYWSHLKRTITGSHHFVSPKHLGLYCAAQDYRHNTLGMDEWERVKLIYTRPGQPLGWKRLKAANHP